jgi:hypothetical protein
MANSVGRPKIQNKRVTLAVRVAPYVKDWLSGQGESSGKVIEKLVRDKLAREKMN